MSARFSGGSFLECPMTLVNHPRHTDAERDTKRGSAAVGVRWTDDALLEPDRAASAPNAPGVLVLLRGTAAEEVLVWAEDVRSLRARACELCDVPQRGELRHLLDDLELRFRCATIQDPERRAAFARALREASGHAPPAGRSRLVFYDVELR
jgi:hypothetical protein